MGFLLVLEEIQRISRN